MSDREAAAPAAIAPPPRLALASTETYGARSGKTSRLVCALILVLFALLRLWRLTAYGLFSDEVFSAETAHRSWSQLQRAVIADVVHPPLFYYLLKVWITMSDALVWMKLLPVLFAMLTVIPFVLLCRELKLRQTAINLALCLMAVNEYLINYAQELRMYSLLLLLLVTSMWLFAKLVNASNRALAVQVALLATNLLLVYTHYYGWLIVASELLFVIVKRRDLLLSFTLSATLLVVGFTPWAIAVIEAAYDKGGLGPNLRWNTRPTANDFFQHYVTLNGPVYASWRIYAIVFSSLLFLTPILLWVWRGERAKGEKGAGKPASGGVLLWLMLLAFLPTIIAFAASYLLAQSVWGSRFLIVVAPAYLLLAAIAATQLNPQKLRRVVVALMVAWAALSGALQLTHRDKINWQPLVERLIQQQADSADHVSVYTKQGVAGATIQYYLDQAGAQGLRVRYVDNYGAIDERRFWIAFLRYRHETGPLPSEQMAARGDRLGEAIEADAPGHQVIFIPVERAYR